MEALEDRLLLSQSPKLLLDINPGAANSSARQFTQVNNLEFFTAIDGAHGRELWVSNGTAAGTSLVKDINPGGTGSYPTYLTNLNGTLFFNANDGTHGVQIWESNGTQAGTFLFQDINPGVPTGSPFSLTNVNGSLFFAANDGSGGSELFAGNGVAAGTFEFRHRSSETISYGSLTNVNGTLFFADNNGTTGFQLWESNGTNAGTFPLPAFGPQYLTDVSGTLFFRSGGQLWESNGTAAGTFMVKDINPGGASSYIYYPVNANGTLFFLANDGTHGFELWESNGTAAGTSLVADINPGSANSFPQYLTNVNGTVFFQANDGTHGEELWESNGSASGTFLVADINPGGASGYARNLANENGTVFFEASDGIHGSELWESNGSAAGTFLVADINPGGSGSYPYKLASATGALFFAANDGTHGVEPWILIPSSSTSVSSSPNPAGFGQTVTFTATVASVLGLTPTGTVDFMERSTDLTPGGVTLTAGQATFSTSSLAIGSHTITALYSGDGNFPAGQGDDSANPQAVNKDSLLLDINPGNAGSNPKFFTQVNNLTFFSATDGAHGQELWASNGTTGGTFMVKDINPGATGSYPNTLANVNGTLFFGANDGTHGNELWESNGSAAGTFLVQDINPGSAGSYLYQLTNVSGTLFFDVNDRTDGVQLWESNGSAAGTFLVQAFVPQGLPLTPANVNGTLFFSANDHTHGVELWESNGSAAGTLLVQDINPGPRGSSPQSLANVNGTLFFSADDGTHGEELWESNGTAAGTFLVKDINPGPAASQPFYQTNVNGTLFFGANDGSNGFQLWESNGSAAGTFLVKDISSGTYGSLPYHLTNVNGTLFFDAKDNAHGRELWESNGTAVGTFLVKDIDPGSADSTPTYLENVNGTLFLSANDGSHGTELWESNGTAAGTFLVQDIDPGTSGSNPQFLTNVNGELFFSASDGIHGTEPWILVSTATTTSVSSTPNPSVLGQAVTFTATIGVGAGVPAGAPSPTGTVDFKEGSTDLTPGGVRLTNDRATFSVGSLAVGSDTITAVYSGDGNFTGSLGNDSARPQVVQKDSTSVNLVISPATLVSGQLVGFVAVVANTSGPFGIPTGQVQFKVDGTNLGSPVTLQNGVARLPDQLSATGSPHTITAAYTNSDGNFVGGSKTLTQAVAKDGTKTILTSVTSAVSGQVVVFTATINPVAPGSGTPTGTVDFKDGASDLTPGGISLSAGRAFFSTSSLGLGSHTITASYSGEASFTLSSGNDLNSLVVNKASTRTVMTSFPDPSVFGQVVSFTVAVIALAPSQGTPTGTVTFTDGATTIGTVTVNTVGRATFTTSSLSRGNHAINANYGGDAKFLTSSDMGFGETVQKDATTATVTASANPAVVGTTVTFTATLQASSPGAGIPTGTVTFLDITTTLGTGKLNAAGKATFTTSALALGTHAIKATYGGDNNFLASVSAISAETVKSSAQAMTQSRALALSGVRPLASAPVLAPELLLDINPGSTGSNPKFYTQVNQLAFFTANDGVHGTELWERNGTAAGTFLVKDINPGTNGSNPKYLTNMNGTLFFSADDGMHGPELWRSDGTATGTFLVVDTNPGTPSYTRYLTNVNGTLFFSAYDGTHGQELWESNGSAAGTFMVKDIYPGGSNGGYSSLPEFLTNVNGTLFFQANDGTHGYELWESNGSAAGTFLVKDIDPGPSSSSPGSLTNVNGTLFFGADDGTHGEELWQSNGSAAGTFLVADINPGSGTSNLSDLTNVSGTLFFQANDGTHGYELWESNGSAAGTFLVKDINPGAASGYAAEPANVNGTLFFQAFDGTHGTELWRSNGAPAGTFLVKDINPGPQYSSPLYLTNVNGTLFFQANDGIHGAELWESNGSAGGTFMMADINPGTSGSYPKYLTNLNGTLFFSADDGTHGSEPCILIDSTVSTTSVSSSPNPSALAQAVTFTATVLVGFGLPAPTGTVDFKEGATDLTPGGLTLAGSQATFSTAALTGGSHTITAIYSGDGNFKGSQADDSASPQVVAFAQTLLSSSPNPSGFGQAVTFTATVQVGVGLPAPTGTVDFKEGATDLTPGGVTLAGNQATFSTAALTVGSHTITAIYSGNSNYKGSQGDDSASPQVVDLIPTLVSSSPNPSLFGQAVTFTATVDVPPGLPTPTGGVDFKEGATDLTPGDVALAGNQATFSTAALTLGSHTITAIYSGDSNFKGSQGDDSASPQIVDNIRTLVSSSPNRSGFRQGVTFTATVQVGVGLPAPTGTVDFKEGATDLTPGGVSLTGGQATFSTTALTLGSHTITAIYSGDSNFKGSQGDDSASPQVVNYVPTLLLDINTGGAGAKPFYTEVNNLVFFSANDGAHGFELWESNGAAAGTFLVKDINPGTNGSYPYYLTNVNGTLFFEANDGTHGYELWESNGSVPGTFMVKDINPGSASSYPTFLTNVNGTLFFEANDGTHGYELWESNGSAAGTFLVQDINPGSANSYPKNLTNVNGTLFFTANDGTNGIVLWESNGTAAGTFLVRDINPGSITPYARYFTNVNGTLFFQAQDPIKGKELWESDGTAAGTFLVQDIGPRGKGFYSYGLTNVNGTLFFSANDSTHGYELWESNGSAAGTFLVQDINPGSANSYPSDLTNVNGTLFFQANDGTHGLELWESNGTAAGTFLVRDINPGAAHSKPNSLTNVSGTLFFQADDGTDGPELWESNGTVAGTFLVQDINPGTNGSNPVYLTNVNGALIFTADDGTDGVEPWILPVSTANSTTVSSSPEPSGFGQAVTFTATVHLAPGSASPTGTVDFKEGATDLTPGGVALAGNQATFSTALLTGGSHTITATYSGDGNFNGSLGNDSAKPQIVHKDTTSTKVLTGPSLVSGQAVVLSAIVSNTSGPFGAPTGAVQFAIDGTKVGSPVTLVSGVASLPTRLLAAGSPHTVTATYTNSDGDFASGSGWAMQAVAKDGTKTILISTPTTAVSGQVVVFTAIVNPVAPGRGTPTGTVDFKEGATDLTPAGVTLAGGRAFFSTSSLGLGSHTITASYGGDANFTGSSGNDLKSLVVNKASTRTVMTSFPDPSVFGQVVSFTVAVIALAPSQGTPTGTVTFTDGTTTIGSVTVNNVGRATFTTASLSLGNHAINANYGGDAKFKVSSDTGFGETVQKDATAATVTASANPAVLGTTITFTATIQASSPGAGIPTGTVSFLDITTTLGTGTLNAAGKATFTTSALALGTHAISASYAGDNNFLASPLATLAETVKSSAAVSSALAFSALRPTDPVSGTASTQATPQAQAVTGTTLAQSSAAAPTAATLDPSQLDRYFAAVTTASAARRLAQLATPKRDPADWLDDPFFLTN
jgi:ELWxxDGT repeat protein